MIAHEREPMSEAMLTDEGRTVMERVLKAASRFYHHAFASFDDEVIEQLIRLLARGHGAPREPF
jgi:DNA-binding MarR family transcriptional regulator